MNRLGRITVIAGIATVAMAGCGFGRAFAPTPDDLSTWQRVPLAPDPHLSQSAANFPPCRPDVPDGVAIEILLQDRRTETTAAFLVRGPVTFGSCMYSASGGGGGGGSQPAVQLQPLDVAISVDEDGSGGVADGTATYLGGRVGPEVGAVRVEVRDDLVVEASVANGYWLAWWPDAVRASRVLALDAAGIEVLALTLGPDGWTAE